MFAQTTFEEDLPICDQSYTWVRWLFIFVFNLNVWLYIMCQVLLVLLSNMLGIWVLESLSLTQLLNTIISNGLNAAMFFFIFVFNLDGCILCVNYC